MKFNSRRSNPAMGLFILTVALYLVFFCLSTGERVSVYHPENHHHYTVLTDVEMALEADETAPAGVRKIYRGILAPEYSPESCLCFNIAHNDIQVWFGDTLVYSLTGDAGNRIARNVGSNWCSVHVGVEHAGQPLTVILTPLFDVAVEKTPTFLLGSHHAIAMELLRTELPQIVLSAICILLGIFVVAVSLYFRWFVRSDSNAMVYLGFFSAFLGTWKLMDLPSLPLLLPEDSIALAYTSVGALFLTGVCLLMYFSTLFEDRGRRAMRLLACAGCVLCLVVLGQQVLGITELRQNLVYSHVLLIAAIGSGPVVALCNRIFHKKFGLVRPWPLLVLLVGIVLDLSWYYLNQDNATISFAVLGFVVYTLVVFVDMVQRATRKANTDPMTGLVNRRRWNMLMQAPGPEACAILVMDLNGLKTVNDTLGHVAGDRMINCFAGILRDTLPHSSVICRWGGDEFAAMLHAVTRPMLDRQIEALAAAVEAYNGAHPELPIHYAVGTALSDEHPGASRSELFRLADGEMYRSKQQWYSERTGK